MTILQNVIQFFASCGIAVAMIGAALAVGLPCSGSAIGVGSVGRNGAFVLRKDPSKFSRVLILQILPGTQGLYGLVVWFFALMKLGFFSGKLSDLTLSQGLQFFAACIPVMVCGLVCGIIQGRICADGLSLVSERPGELSKGIILAIMMEFYAILALLASFLMLNNFESATQYFATNGTAFAMIGAALAVGLPCAGSAIGVGTVGRAGAGVLSVDTGKFSRVLILQILPGTQGLYGLVVWFFALMKLGFFSGNMADLTLTQGLQFMGACLPVAVGGLIFGMVQGRICAGGLSLMTKKPGDLSKSIILAIMMEFYAILALLASFLMLNSFAF